MCRSTYEREHSSGGADELVDLMHINHMRIKEILPSLISFVSVSFLL